MRSFAVSQFVVIVILLVGWTMTTTTSVKTKRHLHRHRSLPNVKDVHGMEQYLDASSCAIESAPRLPHARPPQYHRNQVQSFAVALYACKDGYALLDGTQRMLYCAAGGKWIGATPICVKRSASTIDGNGREQMDGGQEWWQCATCPHSFEMCAQDADDGVRCVCKPGFRRVNDTCYDINECKGAKTNHGCAHQCHNLPGSYKCACRKGYSLQPDGTTCADINECLLRNGHGPCEETCVNTEGGYTCGCRQKQSRLAPDGHTCDMVDECNGKERSGCSHGCISTRGRMYCTCPEGMLLDADWKTCNDLPLADAEYYNENEEENEYIDGDEEGDEEEGDADEDDYDDEENKRENEDDEEYVRAEAEHRRRLAEQQRMRIEAERKRNEDEDARMREEQRMIEEEQKRLEEMQRQLDDEEQRRRDEELATRIKVESIMPTTTTTEKSEYKKDEEDDEDEEDEYVEEDETTIASIQIDVINKTEESTILMETTTVIATTITTEEEPLTTTTESLKNPHEKEEEEESNEIEEEVLEKVHTWNVGATTPEAPPPEEENETSTESSVTNGNHSIPLYEKDEYDEEDSVSTEKPPLTTTINVVTMETTIKSEETTTTTKTTSTTPKLEDDDDEEEEEEDYEYTYEEYDEDDLNNEIFSIPVLSTPRPASSELPSSTTSTTTTVSSKLCNTGYILNENFDCVDINECEDLSHGCSDGCANTPGSYHCTCPIGYEITVQDKYMCQDIDECALNMCSHNCHNLPGTFRCECPDGWLPSANGTQCKQITCAHGYSLLDGGEGFVCKCPEGYTLNENDCVDVDECTHSNPCEQQCTNTPGSYTCACRSGYLAIGNDCEDIDECLNNNANCTQLCANEDGAYQCGCESGYYLSPDNHTCLEIDLCAMENNNGGCSDLCRMDKGNILCSCHSGRELINATVCKKINPCKINNGGCSHQCVYEEHDDGNELLCDCPDGHRLMTNDTKTCELINPCFENNGGCSHLCTVAEDLSEAICSCPDESYELLNRTCFKINLCLHNNGGCSHICHFVADAVQCTCPESYKLFGKTCEKRNLCEVNNGGCSHFCNFIDEQIVCECPDNYELIDRTCERIDPCLIENGGCSHECISDEYEVECHCPINYELEKDNRTCKAQDPCYNNGDCSHFCMSRRGKSFCFCPYNYELDADEKTCMRIDPCLENNGNCSHICTYSNGAVECACPKELILANGTKCINPCAKNNGGCSHECRATNGMAICQCPIGFALDVENNPKQCKRINPCVANNGGCSHQCVEVEGQAICKCPEGERYELIAFKTCRLIDPCLINNGGCSHTCATLNNRVKCECPGGYRLHGKVCLKEDPCHENNGGCSHNCTMKHGLKICECPSGFVLRPNRRTCKDINECMIHNGGCSHTCRNMPGGYKCLCPKGFRLEGNRTCVTGRGCAYKNGGCEQTCMDLPQGNHKCACRHGYELRADGKGCEETSFFECSIKTLQNGRVKCTRGGQFAEYVAVGTQCLYSCDKGYKLTGESLRTCEYSGDWDVDEPICTPAPVACPKLTPPLRGRILPQGCMTTGHSCSVHCRGGYRLAHEQLRNFSCGPDSQWTHNITDNLMRSACIAQEIPKPFIRCPAGGQLSFTLPEGERSMTIKIPRPDSNVDWWRYVHSTPAWGKTLTTNLPAGRYEVVFSAQMLNHTAQCTLVIHVKDDEPPKVYGCPANQEVRLERGDYTRNVYWTEPHFLDNIGVRTVYKSKTPGAQFPYGLHHVNYIASDDAGNRAYCHFSINVVSYYQHERTSSATASARYRSVLICPHGVQYMSNTPDNYDNNLTTEHGCKWTYIRLRQPMGQHGYKLHATTNPQMQMQYQRRTNHIQDIPMPYTTTATPVTTRRYPRQHFNWCC